MASFHLSCFQVLSPFDYGAVCVFSTIKFIWLIKYFLIFILIFIYDFVLNFNSIKIKIIGFLFIKTPFVSYFISKNLFHSNSN
jgi:hypothetical protein